MVAAKTMKGKRLHLRALDISDCNDSYLRWMNDAQTNMYMETRWQTHTMERIREFVKDSRESSNNYSFAIVDNATNLHIGNIKLGPIDVNNRNSDVSYFLGEKEYQGKGYATEAVTLVTKFAFDFLDLHKLHAGVIDGNEASVRVLEKAGFVLEGKLSEKFFVNGKFADHLLFGMIRSN